MSVLSSVMVNIPTTGPVPTAVAIARCAFTIFIAVTLTVALFHPDDHDRDDARRILTGLLNAVVRVLTRRSK